MSDWWLYFAHRSPLAAWEYGKALLFTALRQRHPTLFMEIEYPQGDLARLTVRYHRLVAGCHWVGRLAVQVVEVIAPDQANRIADDLVERLVNGLSLAVEETHEGNL